MRGYIGISTINRKAWGRGMGGVWEEVGCEGWREGGREKTNFSQQKAQIGAQRAVRGF